MWGRLAGQATLHRWKPLHFSHPQLPSHPIPLQQLCKRPRCLFAEIPKWCLPLMPQPFAVTQMITFVSWLWPLTKVPWDVTWRGSWEGCGAQRQWRSGLTFFSLAMPPTQSHLEGAWRKLSCWLWAVCHVLPSFFFLTKDFSPSFHFLGFEVKVVAVLFLKRGAASFSRAAAITLPQGYW